MKKVLFVFVFAILAVIPTHGQLRITTTVCPTMVIGVPYQCQIQATGGTPPYHFSVSAGELPAGLTLSDSGLISGTIVACTATLKTNCFPYAPKSLQIMLAGNKIQIPVRGGKKPKKTA